MADITLLGRLHTYRPESHFSALLGKNNTLLGHHHTSRATSQFVTDIALISQNYTFKPTLHCSADITLFERQLNPRPIFPFSADITLLGQYHTWTLTLHLKTIIVLPITEITFLDREFPDSYLSKHSSSIPFITNATLRKQGL